MFHLEVTDGFTTGSFYPITKLKIGYRYDMAYPLAVTYKGSNGSRSVSLSRFGGFKLHQGQHDLVEKTSVLVDGFSREIKAGVSICYVREGVLVFGVVDKLSKLGTAMVTQTCANE